MLIYGNQVKFSLKDGRLQETCETLCERNRDGYLQTQIGIKKPTDYRSSFDNNLWRSYF